MSWSDDRAVDAVHWQILRNHLKPNVWPASREMLKYKQELDTARHSDLNQLASVVQEMKNKLSYLKKTASDVNKIKTVGFENFRRDIKTFESKLSKLKERGSKKLREDNLNQLALIEEIDRVKQLALHDDVSSKSSRDAGAVGGKKKELKCAKRVPISKNTYKSKEIAEFHDFCARNYGLTGGWTSKDHEIFLKIRSKHVDSANLIDHVVQAMPHITKDAARQHENWFVKFEELKAKQKEAIIKWKNEKKNIVMYNNNSNTSDPLKKCADNNVPEISLKISNGKIEKQTNDNNALQCEIVESKKLDNFDKMLLKRFREKDKKYIESKKTTKQRLEGERASDSITVVALHGKSEKYDDMESLEKLPNVHFSFYGAHNPDLKVVLKYQ